MAVAGVVRVAERYDAAIIGAGADGLVAAALLARAGLRTIVLERGNTLGGRLAMREFHPGFHASPFAGSVPPLPASLFWDLELARFGGLLAPALPPAAVFSGGRIAEASPLVIDSLADAARRRAVALTAAAAPVPPPHWLDRFRPPSPDAWPAEIWSQRALAELAAHDDASLLAAVALEGRAGDPWSPGSALNLLAGVEQGIWRGGLGGLAAALAAAARAAGAEIAFARDVSDIRCEKDRVVTLALADGSDLAARAILSTLDIKRTFLSLFAWSRFPKEVVDRVGHVRMAGSTARMMVALATPPAPLETLRRTLYVAPDISAFVEARAAWRMGLVAPRLPLVLRVESATDPSLAPAGAAVLSVTIGCVPHTPFDGGWTPERRDALRKTVLASLEDCFPGLAVLDAQLLVPPDIEGALGATNGDLDGGEIAPDQMFALRPGLEPRWPRTPIHGLYLAGPSTAAGPLATGVSGAIAARALLADHRARRLP
ncbi:MAG: NAD(P)/FAD-dependent oxidoreductase [Proteobacteria bacterium]|nr:NAD(P)/FAD-dependent oxidoreductase [Pseudomonadota bacterium]